MSEHTNLCKLIDESLLGIPYLLGGRTREGADCIGTVILWLETQGIHYKYDDSQGPVLRNWWAKSPRRFLDAMLKLGTIVDFRDVRKFDCLMFVLGNEGNTFPSCIGIMVDERHMITSTEERGSFVEMLNIEWKKRFFGAIRLRKIVEAGL